MIKFISFGALCLLTLGSACTSDPNKTSATTPTSAGADSLSDKMTPVVNPWKNTACDLVTDQEFYAVFNIEEKRDFANRRSLPDQGYCLRTWKKTDWREREIKADKNPNIATNPESALVIQILDYSTLAVASSQFEMHRRDHINGYSTDVPDLGEGAIWSNTQGMLMVKKGSLCLQIKLDHADNAADNLPKAKELAAIALKKM